MSMFVFVILLGLVFVPLGVIDVVAEQLVTLAQLAKRIPARRNERPVHPSTIHRWRSPGIGGIRLDCIRIGGAWHTSMEAFQRFCLQLSNQSDSPASSTATAARADRTADAEHLDRVDRELDRFLET